MSELDELKEQRKEIDRKIKELLGVDVVCEDAKFFIQRYPTIRADDYCIALKCRKGNGLNTWKTVAAEADEAHAIGRLRKLIQDANGLLNLLEGKTT